MQCCSNKLIYIKTNLFLHLVRNISTISTFLMQDLKIQGFFLSLEDDKEHSYMKKSNIEQRTILWNVFWKDWFILKQISFFYFVECKVVRINVFTLELCLNIVIRNGKTSFWFCWLWSQELCLRLNETC